MAAVEAQTDPLKIKLDPQDPLPESNWLYRRWFNFGTQAVLLLILAGASVLHEAAIAAWIVVAIICNGIFYTVAPSGEQVAKMLASVSAMKAGVNFATRQEVDANAGTASSVSTAGQAGGPEVGKEQD